MVSSPPGPINFSLPSSKRHDDVVHLVTVPARGIAGPETPFRDARAFVVDVDGGVLRCSAHVRLRHPFVGPVPVELCGRG